MFSSLTGKIIFFLCFIMAVTGIAIVLYTRQNVARTMLEAEQSSSRNVLKLVELNIQGGYSKLLSDKFDMIIGLNARLKDLASLCVSVFEEYRALHDKEILSEEMAKRRSLDWLRAARFERGDLFVFDQNGLVIAHPDQRMEGTSIASLKDMKGRLIAKVMNEKTLKFSGDSAVFSWKPMEEMSAKKKLGYFLPSREWQWTVCALIDFEQIEAESQKKLEKIVEVLKKTLDKVHIGETGFAFMFDGDGTVLIPPPGNRQQDYALLRNEL